jgi:TolB-like protein/class 3 adenylate cyclase/tetratricopeptide (TPR) repeat protein
MVQKPPVRIERRLSAILAADVAGYSRLMHHDEEATHTRLTALLTDSISPAITEHGGRIVKNTGDGFLAEFPSTVQAVRAAVQFQTRIKEITTADAEGSRLAFRVGVNVGDVIVEPHDIFGDGVNVAARLESIAEPGGICISSAAYDQVRGKVGVEFADLGEQNLKNIARPVRAYAVVQEGSNPPVSVGRARPNALSLPRLSIIVLPFANLSGDPEQDYFVDGVTESLTTDLSRISGSFVIGRHTAFSYKGQSIEIKQVGRELNVRYALEGSVQRGGNRLRVNVQLVSTETASHLWAERFDKPITDLFDMQDEIVCRLANTLNAQLITFEARRAERMLNPDAVDLIFQGRARLNEGQALESLTQARGFFKRALALDPDDVDALVGKAEVDISIASTFLSDDRLVRCTAAKAAVTKVLSLSPDYALAHLVLGVVHMITNRAAEGIAECEQALVLDQNLADAHACIGWAKTLLGRSAETEVHTNEALRLSPRDIYAFRWINGIGIAKSQMGADEEAAVWLRRSIDANPNQSMSYFLLAATLARLGNMDDARLAVQAGLVRNTGFTIRLFRANPLSDNPIYLAWRERLYEAMRMAGVPEG